MKRKQHSAKETKKYRILCIRRKGARKNPAFYQYGYHFTTKDKLDNILISGALKTFEPDRSFELSYKVQPIYFLTYNKITFLADSMKDFVRQRQILLKVDVSSYSQYPDFGSLIDFGFQYWPDPDHIKHNKLSPLSKLMKKWVIKFNNKIPTSEFLLNPHIIRDSIATTHSFVILEKIPVSKIISIFEFSADEFGDIKNEIIEN